MVDDDGAAATAVRTVVVAVAENPNLTSNPSFETGTAGWFNYRSKIVREVLPGAPDGLAVAKVSRTSGADYSIDDSPDTVQPATAGHRYTARAVVRAASASSLGKTATLTIRERRPNNTVARRTTASVTLTNSFQPITVTGTVLASGNTIDLYVMQLSAGAGNAFYVDDITLRRL